MGAARGIAGSHAPEQHGSFLCFDEDTADWFVRMNNTGGTVDVWQVEGVDERELVQSPENYFYVPRRVPRADLRLIRQDIPPEASRW
jgi:hypothetical protein